MTAAVAEQKVEFTLSLRSLSIPGVHPQLVQRHMRKCINFLELLRTWEPTPRNDQIQNLAQNLVCRAACRDFSSRPLMPDVIFDHTKMFRHLFDKGGM